MRFEKTYKAVVNKEIYPHEELISLSSDIPSIHQMVQELSQPVWTQNGKGKMLVDKRPDGALSPNLADSIVMCMSPMRDYGPGIGYLQFMRDHVAKQKPPN